MREPRPAPGAGYRRAVTSTVAWTLGVPAVIAVVGLLVTYLSSLVLARRKDRLDRVNEQLKDFYGPLLALVSASNATWVAFREQYRTTPASYWSQSPPPSEAEAQAWRRWMTTVFMPVNRQLRDLVVSKAHLLDGTEMPECLLTVCAHVAAYEAILDRWSHGDHAEHKPPIPFPGGPLARYATTMFGELKDRQQRLLRHRGQAR